MKALKMDHKYFKYPEECSTLEQFIEYVNSGNPARFVPLIEYLHDHCLEPYFIKSETAFSYVNMGQVYTIQEINITVFSKEEYKRRLELAVQDHCLNCELYREDRFWEDPFYFGDKISLDGKCPLKMPI
ncbi:MAG: hypothetical protein WBI17_01945 [Clostridiaceae bacterium]